MKAARFAQVVVLSLTLGAAALGCGGGQEAKSAKVAAGDMPSGQEWTGVYYNQQFGNLHLVEEGTNVVGRWKRTDQSHWGELSGTKTGNLLRFTWKEHKVGMVGASADTEGKGYFLYGVNKDGLGELKGEYGLGGSEVGSRWDGLKQKDVKPNLKEIGGDAPGIATPGATKGWD
jgi:hypothetical protein